MNISTDDLLWWMSSVGFEINLRYESYSKWKCSWTYKGMFVETIGITAELSILNCLFDTKIDLDFIQSCLDEVKASNEAN